MRNNKYLMNSKLRLWGNQLLNITRFGITEWTMHLFDAACKVSYPVFQKKTDSEPCSTLFHVLPAHLIACAAAEISHQKLLSLWRISRLSRRTLQRYRTRHNRWSYKKHSSNSSERGSGWMSLLDCSMLFNIEIQNNVFLREREEAVSYRGPPFLSYEISYFGNSRNFV